MADLSPQQAADLDRRRAEFAPFFADAMPVLVDFCTVLELETPHEVLNDPEPFVEPIAQWLSTQDLAAASHDDRVWLSCRVGYFIGEVFVRRYSGCWFVDDLPASNWFSHFVVGQFPRYPNARIAPMQMAIDLIDSSSDLHAFLMDASAAIEAST
ncbi:hypothetical protein [Neorhodopirellula lusitana]|uniref:hypothetical protein n=1 Tax=Neorhodopirellula lusitana TaxID=445327 RepID=UPI00384AD60A